MQCLTASLAFLPRNIVWLVLVLMASGCGSSTDVRLAPVAGKVTLDGKPVQQGYIQFMPNGGQGSPGGGKIQDGAYAISQQDGLLPGKYSVIITSFSEAEPAAQGRNPDDEYEEAPVTQARELIPEKYNIATTLVVEIKGSGKNEHDFALTK